MYDRGAEHLTSLRSGDPESALVQHNIEDHPEQDPEFSMRLVKTHTRPMQRQIHESVLIDNFKGDVILNRKGEWGSNLADKLTVGDNDHETGGKRPRLDPRIQGGNIRKKRRCNETSYTSEDIVGEVLVPLETPVQEPQDSLETEVGGEGLVQGPQDPPLRLGEDIQYPEDQDEAEFQKMQAMKIEQGPQDPRNVQGPQDPQLGAGEDQEHDPGTPVADEKTEKRVGRVITAREMLDYLRQAAAKKMEKVSKTDGTKSSHGAKSKCSQAKNKKSNLNNKKKVSTNQNWGQRGSLELNIRTPNHFGDLFDKLPLLTGLGDCFLFPPGLVLPLL